MGRFLKRRGARLPFAIALVGVAALNFWQADKDLAGGLETLVELGRFGQFGDLVGGVLNPVIAGAALWWLITGVRMQKTELFETRAALNTQNDHVLKASRVDAIAAMIETHTADISYRRQHLAFLMSQKTKPLVGAFYSMRGRTLDSGELDKLIASLNKGLNSRTTERARLASELAILLRQTRAKGETAFLETFKWELDEDGAP
jgi:hypothetical protein